MRTHLTRLATMMVFLTAAITLPAVAASTPLPPDHVARLLVRVLAYDRAILRHGDEVTVVVLYRAELPGSELEQIDLVEVLEAQAQGTSIRGRPLFVSAVGYSSNVQLEAALTATRAEAVYLCSGLGDVFRTITDVTRRLGVLSISSSEEQVVGGVAIGLVRRGSRAALVINSAAARAEGARLDPDLLSVATMVP
jgi:hypothetical protein